MKEKTKERLVLTIAPEGTTVRGTHIKIDLMPDDIVIISRDGSEMLLSDVMSFWEGNQ